MAAPGRVRVVLVEDEEPSLRRLRALVEARPQLQLVAECSSAVEAVRVLRAEKPDLVFLDVRLPDLDGFEVVELADPEASGTAVVFVTGFENFASRAFEVGAVDYLLKPIDPERFDAAVERALARVASTSGREGNEETALDEALDGARGGSGFLRRLIARDDHRFVVVPVEQVIWFEGDGNYVRLHCADRIYRVRATLGGLEGRLDPARFCRTHRSTIVSLEHVRDFVHVVHGDYQVRLTSGAEVTLTGARREAFTEALEGRRVTSLRPA